MNIYLVIIVVSLLLNFSIHTLSRKLNLNNMSLGLPDEFKNYYSKKDYKRSQEYLRENTHLSLLISTFELIILMLVIFLGYFNDVDLWVRNYNFPSVFSGLIFFAVLLIIQDIISIPFSLYQIFVIEEKFGFNNTTLRIYILDKIKSYILISIFGGFVLYFLILFFETYGAIGWFYAWLAMSSFFILMQPFFTLVIAPMFNTFTPLQDGELKQRITLLTEIIHFPLSRIDVMDGSRRSSRANAYFSGIGKSKRIALYDTLIEKHSINELIAIIAHELGHYKMKHNIKGIVFGVIQAGIMFFIFSLFLNNHYLFSAFSMDNISVYASLLFFSLLYSPIDLIMSIINNILSRKNEFEADAFAKAHIKSTDHLIEGLKNLTVSNLGNLTPHPFTVWLTYSHPPVLQRILALRNN